MKNKTKFKVNSIVRYNLDYIKTYSPYLETTCKSLYNFIQTDPIGRINSITDNHVSVQWYVDNPARVTVVPKEWLILEELTPHNPTGNGVLYKEYIKSNKHKMNNKKQTTFKTNDRVQYIPTLQNGFITHINKSNPKHPLYTIFSKPKGNRGKMIVMDAEPTAIKSIGVDKKDVPTKEMNGTTTYPSANLMESEYVDVTSFVRKLIAGDILKFPTFTNTPMYARVLGRNGDSIFLSNFGSSIVILATFEDVHAIYTIQELKDAGAILVQLDSTTHTSPASNTLQEMQDMMIYSSILAAKPSYETCDNVHAFINSDMIAQALKDNSAYQNVAEQAPAPSKDDEPKVEEVQIVKNRLISYLVDRIVFYRDERGVSISDFAKMLDELYLLAEVFGITKEVMAGVQEKDMLSRSS